ncbi:hypothetical protein Droror1_Dr00025864 [Drosera rotundifolia]
MAAAAARTNRIRLGRFYHCLRSSPIFSPPSSSSFCEPHHHRRLIPPPPIQRHPKGFGQAGYGLLSSNHRYLCASTGAQSAAAASSDSGTNSSSSRANSNDGSKSEESSTRSGGNEGKPVRGGPVSWLSFFLLLGTGAGLIFYYDREKKKHIEGINDASILVKQGPSAGKAAIGGPFNLVNHDGKNVSDRDLLGKWTIMYFGFTHCPDVCPDELQKLAAAVDKIKEKSELEIVPVFISVDPERDNVEQVRDYVKEFHPKLIGLTGHPDEIRKVAHSYRVYYMKTAEEGSDYLVDHSIVMYLMSPEMEFVKFFGKNNDVNALADGVIREIKQHKKK